MNAPRLPNPAVVVLEPDADLGESVMELLDDAGYAVNLVRDWPALFDALDGATALALVEVPAHGPEQQRFGEALRHPALGTVPLVGLCTWKLQPHPRLSAVLLKPFDPGELLATIARHLRGAA